ncbi:uncharacterized protein LOC129592251 [Paramacrobiotus metropolitanus]|uniref:uncharacterized protein LOC129592251 n=1 Tax=Paramacrobiotus metropolitanus TaxID=2943436 RepID=UPI0024465246|nr:uncharacterized protein LOC129592251 [Paramacrobiotus metropolitanus]
MQNTIFYTYGILAATAFLNPAFAVANDDEDMEITEDIFYSPLNFSDANAIAKSRPKLWPNPAAIPYEMSGSFNQTKRQIVLKALRTMEKATKRCILFEPRTDELDYLYFSSSSYAHAETIQSCYSDLGRIGGYQEIYLSQPSCFDLGVIQFHVMHALGFDYEHKRFDRDQYVEVRNISESESEYKDFYDDLYSINPSMYTFGAKYDYHSIREYSTFAGTTGRSPGMISKKALTVHMGRMKSLSPTDVAKIMIAYKCPLNIIRDSKQLYAHDEDFPLFSFEQMTDEECGAQFNRHCQSDITTVHNCTTRTDFRIVCRSNAPVSVLQRMAVDMAEKPLRLVSIDVEEQLIARYTFAPLQIQVVKLQLRNCNTERVTWRLSDLNFTSLLDFQLYGCRNLIIEKRDFLASKRLRIILFYNSTIETMQLDSLASLPDLRIVSLEALLDEQRYYNFDQSFRNFMRALHCSCEFAWYRAWWRTNTNLRLRAQVGEVYSFDGRESSGRLESAEFGKEELYHPVNCHADQFPLGPEWINYYTQTEYSVNEPTCDAPNVQGRRANTATEVAPVTKSATHHPLQRIQQSS